MYNTTTGLEVAVTADISFQRFSRSTTVSQPFFRESKVDGMLHSITAAVMPAGDAVIGNGFRVFYPNTFGYIAQSRGQDREILKEENSIYTKTHGPRATPLGSR